MDNRILIPERAQSLVKSDNITRNAVICIVVVAAIFISFASSLFNSEALSNTLDKSDEEKVDLLFNNKTQQVAGAKTTQIPTPSPSPSPTITPTLTPTLTPTPSPTPTIQPTNQPTAAPTNTPTPSVEPTQTPIPSSSPTPSVVDPTNTPDQ